MARNSKKTSLSLSDLLRELATRRGLDLRGYKTTSLERRIRHRMAQVNTPDFESYLQLVRRDGKETDALLSTIFINVTHFFRDPQAWDVLQHSVLPPRISGLQPGAEYRAWCAGCSTGEEAYSVAILLSELFGERLPEFDVKVYATDSDHEAVRVARRGEYSAEVLRRLRPEWREKYFRGSGDVLRVDRSLRSMVIFGHGRMETNAAISRVNLLVCRNVLIYFDPPSQKQIMRRFHFSLEPGGVLFLGKAETHLREFPDSFRTLDAKWRIFERTGGEIRSPGLVSSHQDDSLHARAQQELEHLRAYHSTLLKTIEPGVLVLDSKETVITDNESVRRLWNVPEGFVGRPITGSKLLERCPELEQALEKSQHDLRATQRFGCKTPGDTLLMMTVKPIVSESGAGRVGTLIYMDDVSHREILQSTIEELQATSEELQSSNEELETTNEELQSANEELETTNEELQSTNEELETTNEELQTTNEELAIRTAEVNERYAEMLERMPWPVLLVGGDRRIRMWSSGAQKLFGFADPSVRGMAIGQLPLPDSVRERIAQCHRQVVERNRPAVIRNRTLGTSIPSGRFNIHITPLSVIGSQHGVLLMFENVSLAVAAGPSALRRQRQAAPGPCESPRQPAPKPRPKTSPKKKRTKKKQ